MKGYMTGIDEYPQGTYIEYCTKGHWDASPEEREDVMPDSVWENCTDFENKP
jgi:hypothetical protein